MLKRIRNWGVTSPVFACVCFVSCLFIALYLELFHEACVAERAGWTYGLLAGEVTVGVAWHVLAMLLVALALCMILVRQRRLVDWLFAHRVLLCCGIVALCVVLGISGSSLAQWDVLVGSSPRGTLLGISRALRGDEWLVNTGFACSQQYAGYQAWSPFASGGSDVTMVYAQACWAPATLFRPFLWGYLVFGFSGGLAFFWAARTAALFLVSLEMGMLVSKQRRGLSVFFALVLTFSQVVQWWFAVNGMAELFIFGQGLVLVLHRLLRSDSPVGRWAWAACMAWLACCFAFILYPAWQVPIAYVCAAMGVWVLVEHRSSRTLERPSLSRTILPLACSAVFFGAIAAVAVFQAWDVIDAVRSSQYPGGRFETGGGLASRIFDWGYGLFAPVVEGEFLTADGAMNACEYVGVFGLFPLGIVLACIQLRKRRDALIVAVLVAYAILGAYAFVGFPDWLARVTLLSNVPAMRVLLALGYLDVVLLVRVLSLADGECLKDEGPHRLWGALAAAALFTVVAMVFFSQTLTEGKRVSCMVLLGVLVFACAFVVLAPRGAFGRGSLGRGSCMAMLACTIAVPGLCVNPLQMGTDALTDNSVGNVIASVQEDQPGTWIADEAWESQLVLAQGATCLTSVSTYPHLALWGTIDASGSYVDDYNRYAWITVREAADATTFETTRPDGFTVRLALADARKLGVTYWLTSIDFSDYSGTDEAPELVCRIEGANLAVYRL